ncbi:gamma-glutamyl AIG2-like cyclotransferase [Tamaricihabitans halophyticus]|uniref:Gamma-glutamyl AIG2-like cyclotransferase n=1 Tax=Tamaricihabitans halophyticus TaxID=1262583 RepID=A0A4R2RB53_9PSEU|nr:gamma-glutamylcyclotransferase [Tamaricihabitans halophyticus]TCP56941.1 gamma-glutamyl AIG2-like cyclotransferase [Tamaricihabitans halophyticus]
MVHMFLNGGGMRGGPLHHQLCGAPLVREARTAPRYRFYSVNDQFPALDPVPAGGVAVHGEVYDVPLETLRDSLLPAEPAELEFGVIELDDGSASLAVLLRREYHHTARLTEISEIAAWRTYQEGQRE